LQYKQSVDVSIDPTALKKLFRLTSFAGQGSWMDGVPFSFTARRNISAHILRII
jgi:hypothetical protein